MNSGPYVGARGPNEFWGNWAEGNGTTGVLYRNSALVGVSNGKTIACSFWINGSNGSTKYFFFQGAGVGLNIFINGSNQIRLNARNSAGSTILDFTVTSPTVSANTTYNIQFSIDLTSTSNRAVYINGTSASVTWNTYTNDTLKLDSTNTYFYNDFDGSNTFYNGKLSEFYFTTDYIDFSVEANRLLFRDAFGNPTDLPAAITAGTVPNPAIYMRFDPAAQGTNSGTGGNFTKSGTISDAGNL